MTLIGVPSFRSPSFVVRCTSSFQSMSGMVPVSSWIVSSTSRPGFPFFLVKVRGSCISAMVAWMLQSMFCSRFFIFL